MQLKVKNPQPQSNFNHRNIYEHDLHDMAKNTMNKTSVGVDENTTSFLCYLLGWVSGLAIFLIEKENNTVRFHAMQSMVTFGGITILSIVFGGYFILWGFLGSLVNMIGIALWVLLMVKAYQGERYRLPVIGDIAEGWMAKFSRQGEL